MSARARRSRLPGLSGGAFYSSDVNPEALELAAVLKQEDGAMSEFVAKRATVWARRFEDGTTAAAVATWAGDPTGGTWTRLPGAVYAFATAHGEFRARFGDWVVKGEDGLAFAVVPDAAFAALYRPAAEPAAGPGA